MENIITDVEYTTDSAINNMIQRRKQLLESKSSSNNEQIPEIVPAVACPAIISKDLADFLNTKTQVAIPDDPTNLNKFILVQNAGVALGKALLKKPKLDPDFYQQVMEKTREYAEILLDAELKLGQQLLSIPTNPGKRTDLQHTDTDVNKSKKEVLAELGITERVAADLQRLTEESVDKAKENARNRCEIVTRKMALEHVRKDHFNRNNIKTSFDGVFDDNDRPDVDTFKDKQPLYYTQLFASTGVGEEKLEQIGLYPSVANEMEPRRCEWYRQRTKIAK